MWFLACSLRLQLLLVVGSSYWMLATADKRILLEPEYNLHQRPPTQDGEPLLIQVYQNRQLCMFNGHWSGKHQPAQHLGGVGEGAVGQP